MLKKWLWLTLAIWLFVGSYAAAAPQRDQRQHHRPKPPPIEWKHKKMHNDYKKPFEWRSKRHLHGDLRLIEDRRWNQHFVQRKTYWRHGPGFFYRGREYQNVVLFYDDNDVLVSFGFWRHGRFIRVHDNHDRYETRDRFFVSYQDENIKIRLGF